MTVRPLSKETAEQLAEWRNMSRNALRTGWTTLEQQERFYEGNFKSDYMYWEFLEKVKVDDEKSGVAPLAAGGFVHIEPKVQRAEIALIVHPQARGQKFGTQCANWILREGFDNQNFKTIWGEVYACGAVAFWEKIHQEYGAVTGYMPNTHFWEGRYWGSVLFSIDREAYAQQERSISLPVCGGDDRIDDEPISPDT